MLPSRSKRFYNASTKPFSTTVSPYLTRLHGPGTEKLSYKQLTFTVTFLPKS